VHTKKVLSQAGTSLADVYDVEGSIAGIDALDIEDIKGVHDLGPQIHSERLLVFQVLADAGATNQNTAWNIVLGAFPDSINRLLSIAVVVDVAGRMQNASIHINDPDTLIDHPIWAWDVADDVESELRWAGPVLQPGARLLRPTNDLLGGAPTLIARGQNGQMPTIVFRGISSAFGAGTVQPQASIQIIRPNTGNPAAGEPSSHGLPIPSW